MLPTPADIVTQLRDRRDMIYHGNGNVTDEPDGLCEEAANEIERLTAENERQTREIESYRFNLSYIELNLGCDAQTIAKQTLDANDRHEQ